jgi:hypothetical protein
VLGSRHSFGPEFTRSAEGHERSSRRCFAALLEPRHGRDSPRDLWRSIHREPLELRRGVRTNAFARQVGEEKRKIHRETGRRGDQEKKFRGLGTSLVVSRPPPMFGILLCLGMKSGGVRCDRAPCEESESVSIEHEGASTIASTNEHEPVFVDVTVQFRCADFFTGRVRAAGRSGGARPRAGPTYRVDAPLRPACGSSPPRPPDDGRGDRTPAP